MLNFIYKWHGKRTRFLTVSADVTTITGLIPLGGGSHSPPSSSQSSGAVHPEGRSGTLCCAAWIRVIYRSKRIDLFFLSAAAFPMFVPSLPWQKDGVFWIYTWLENRRF